MVVYAPGTEETDPKKQNISLQQNAAANVANAAAIATNTSNISANTSSISTINTTLTAIQGAWTSYTPTLAANSGTFTSATASGRYLAMGKTVHVALTVTITTNGTAAGSINLTLPTNLGSAVYSPVGRDSTSGKMLQGLTFSTNKVAYVNYDNTYPGANGVTHNISLVYESA